MTKDMDCWKKVHELGSGSYSTVYLAYSSGDPIAVKSAYWEDTFAIELLEREAQILYYLAGAPNIVQCLGNDTSVEDYKYTYNLLLEYAPFGDLEDLINKNGPMSELMVACYTSMILRGIDEMHSREIVHCDLKPANILVFQGRHGDVINELKIADLGLAKWVSEGVINDAPIWEGSGKRYYNRGTATTASPESVRWGTFGDCGYHGPCADIWSIGCIVYQMLTGQDIWNFNGNMEKLYDRILNDPIPIPENLSPDGVKFLEKCLTRDKTLRRSAKLLLKHPWIVKNQKIMSETFGINVLAQNGEAPRTWISGMNLFSDRTNDGQLSSEWCSTLISNPAGSCYHENQLSASSSNMIA